MAWTYGVTAEGYPSYEELFDPLGGTLMESAVLSPEFRNNDCTQIVSAITPRPGTSPFPNVHTFDLALQRTCPAGAIAMDGSPLAPLTETVTVFVAVEPKADGGWRVYNAQLGDGTDTSNPDMYSPGG